MAKYCLLAFNESKYTWQEARASRRAVNILDLELSRRPSAKQLNEASDDDANPLSAALYTAVMVASILGDPRMGFLLVKDAEGNPVVAVNTYATWKMVKE